MRFILMYCLLSLFSLLQRHSFAVQKSYLVYLGSYSNGGRRLTADPQTVRRSHQELLSLLKSNVALDDQLIYSYTKIFNGFAAVLHEEEAKELAKNRDVIAVFESRTRNLQTTRSWEFLGLEHNGVVPKDSLWSKAKFGEDIIIANLDSGVWPESKSFSDQGFGPIPKKFKGRCENEHDPKFQCNRKLIGARYFYKGFSQTLRLHNLTFSNTMSPRDTEGHGTHTLSTAGGNFVHGANYLHGFANGTAKGGSPRARVVAYKTCWPRPPNVDQIGSCDDADVLAGYEAAIDDDVDIISFSLGGSAVDYFEDVISIGSFHAVKNGITVVACAGNQGPEVGTVANVSPWILTVAASSLDREFTSSVLLGNREIIKGASLASKALPANQFYPLISGADANVAGTNTTESLQCMPGSLDPMKVKGKIVVCLVGGTRKVEKGVHASEVGAVGMIIANDRDSGSAIIADLHVLPTSHISYRDGLLVFSYINSTRSPAASLSQAATEVGIKPAPVMASFSSRGPNTITPGILKPDITAPGTNILAAYSEAEELESTVPTPFSLQDGTSMACPHISGIVGLLKKLYPHLSPSALKSALMTTASTIDNTERPIREADMSVATPFAYGSGHVRPNVAMDPGLVYDMDNHDYLNFLCAIGYKKEIIKKFSKHSYRCPKSVSVADLNYPSITLPDFSGNATVTRRVKNVGKPSIYTARIEPPPGVSITVEPKTMRFLKKGQEIMYKLNFIANGNNLPRDYAFGNLVWSDGNHIVRSPIVVRGKPS